MPPESGPLTGPVLRYRGICSEQTRLRGETAMAEGLILLAFLGALTALFTVRVRRRMGVASSSRTWLIVITAVILAGLLLWASATH